MIGSEGYWGTYLICSALVHEFLHNFFSFHFNFTHFNFPWMEIWIRFRYRHNKENKILQNYKNCTQRHRNGFKVWGVGGWNRHAGNQWPHFLNLEHKILEHFEILNLGNTIWSNLSNACPNFGVAQPPI